MAYDTLKIIRHVFDFDKPVGEKSRLFRKKPPKSNTSKLDSLEPAQKRRLIGRYGSAASYVADIARTDELTSIPGTNNLWAELRYAAREEGVVHLDDLLLRRIRIGITLQHGGMKFIYKIKHIVQSELNWTEKKWEYEVEEYIKLINRSYSYQSRS
jgi:glycerol-3-phosphate dehydrogenase